MPQTERKVLSRETRQKLRDKITSAMGVVAAIASRLSDEIQGANQAGVLTIEEYVEGSHGLECLVSTCEILSQTKASLEDDVYEKVNGK